MTEGSPSTPFQIDLQQPQAWERRARVEVSADHLEATRRGVIQRLRRQVSMPGFRKGKVPEDVVRREFGDRIERETLEAVIPQAYNQLLDEHGDLRPVAEPRVENLHVHPGEPAHFDLALEVRPEITLAGYKGMALERVVVPVTEPQVDDAMRQLAERNARWNPVTRQARTGDAALIDFAPLSEDGSADEAKRTKDYPVELGGEGVLPEFDSALQGMHPGEDTRVDVSYPADYPRKDLAGKSMRFHVALKELRAKDVPALDDDFARSVSPHPTLPELRTAMRGELERAGKRESDRILHELAIDRILHENEVPVPPSLEARYLQAILADVEKGSGKPLDDEARNGLWERFRPLARRAVQRMFVLEQLRRLEGLDVSDEELHERLAQLAQQRATSADELRRALQANNSLERLRNDLVEDKVFALLEQYANVTVVERTTEELAQASAALSAAGEGFAAAPATVPAGEPGSGGTGRQVTKVSGEGAA